MVRNTIQRVWQIILAVAMMGQLMAADPVQPTISVSYKNTRLEAALRDVQEKSGLRVAYRPRLLDGAKPVTLTVSDGRPLDVLDDLLSTHGLVAIATDDTLVAVAPSTSRLGRQKRFGHALHKIDDLLLKKNKPKPAWTLADERSLQLALIDVWACILVERLDRPVHAETKTTVYDSDLQLGAVLPILGSFHDELQDKDAQEALENHLSREKNRLAQLVKAPCLQFIEGLVKVDWEAQNPAQLRAMRSKLNRVSEPTMAVENSSPVTIENRVREVSKSANTDERTLVLAKLAQVLPGFAKAISNSNDLSAFAAQALEDPGLTRQVLGATILNHIRPLEALLELMDRNPTRVAGRLMLCDLLFRRFDSLSRAQKDRLYNWVLAQKEPTIKSAFWRRAGDVDYRNVGVVGHTPFQTDFIVQTVAFSQDSRLLAVGGHKGLEIWDLETRTRKLVIPVSNSVYGTEFLDNDSKLLIHYESLRNSGQYSHGPPVVIWDLKANQAASVGHLPKSPTLPQNLSEKLLGNTPRIDFKKEWWSGRKHAVSPVVDIGNQGPGQVVIVSGGLRGYGPHILAWDSSTGKSVEGIMNAARLKTPTCSYAIELMRFSPDGSRLFCLDAANSYTRGHKDTSIQATVWTWPGRKILHAWNVPAPLNARSATVSWLPDNKRIIFAGGDSTYLLAAGNGEILREFRGAGLLDASSKRLFLVNPDESEVIVQNTENWKIESSTSIAGLNNHSWNRLRLSPDGRWLTAGFYGQTCILVDLSKKQLVSPVTDGHTSVPNVEYTADGRLIAYDGGKVRIYDSQTLRTSNILRTWAGRYRSLGPAGRLLLGYQGVGEVEVWDTLQAKLLDTLPSPRRYLAYSAMSKNGQWCAIMGEKTGRLQFHDLKTNQPMKTFKERHKDYSKYTKLQKVLWDSSGRAFVADRTGITVRAFSGKPLGLKPIGFTGCLNPATGDIVYRFKTSGGQPIEAASNLAYSEKTGLVYLNATVLANHPRPGNLTGFQIEETPLRGVWNAEDGTFVRTIEWPEAPKGTPEYNRPAQFTADGKWLVSTTASVEVETGKVVATFPKGAVSPSGTLVATMKENRIHILDTRSGVEVWQTSLDRDKIRDAKPSHYRVSWHPAETQVTIGFETNPALLVVDLFKTPDLNALDDNLQLQNTIRQLGNSDPNVRKRAVYALVQASAANTAPIGEFFTGKDIATDQKRLVALALEWKAREGDTAAYNMLKQHRANTGPAAEFAASALVRLAAGERVTSLAKDYANPQPFPWVVSEKTKQERQEQIARFDADGDGTLSKDEILQAAETMLQSLEAKGLKGKWKSFDTNKNGFLEQGERDTLLNDLVQRLTE